MTDGAPPTPPGRGTGQPGGAAGRVPAAVRWAGFAVAVGVQLWALYAPRVSDPAPGIGLDKVGHVLLFAAVAWTGVLAGVPVRPLVAVLFAHAVISELVQHAWLPHRTGDPLDSLADAAGVLLGVAAAALPGGRPGPRGRPADAGGEPR